MIIDAITRFFIGKMTVRQKTKRNRKHENTKRGFFFVIS